MQPSAHIKAIKLASRIYIQQTNSMIFNSPFTSFVIALVNPCTGFFISLYLSFPENTLGTLALTTTLLRGIWVGETS